MKTSLINLQAKAHAYGIHANRRMKAAIARPSVSLSMQLCLTVCVGLMLWAMAPDANAQSMGAMPWEGPLCAVANSMRTTVARAAAIIAIVVCGLAMAFGEMNGIFKTLMGLIAGASMALLASSWLAFLGGSSSFC